jgi:oligoribonuclease NrnB/cAMP/cGMP phosphodiesterase (DHH superfamily)
VTWKPDVCLHHSPCDDGFAAAWVVQKKWPDVVIAGTNYGLALPDVNYAGMNVVIVDFSLKPAAIADMMTKLCARSIIMLDHHKTAEADLKDFRVDMCGTAKFAAADIEGMLRDLVELDRPPVAARFDMQRSGASLAWEFCFPDEPMPELIRLIEDRDLWRFNLAGSRAFSLLLRSYPYDFKVWTDIAARLEKGHGPGGSDGLLSEADAIERFYDRRVAEVVDTATLRKLSKWEGVPVAHAPYSFVSDVAHQLLKVHPAAPFAAVVVDSYGERTWSLRSEDKRQDVSEVARQFGGGGHRNAAGFRVPV